VDGAEFQPDIEIQGFTYSDRPDQLAKLGNAIDNAGGWVLERRPTSAASIDIFLEVQACALPEVYAAFLGAGIELTRDSHRALAERCNCSQHLRSSGLASILSIRMELHFLTGAAPPLDLARLLQLGLASA
jgi:hypothetical protein